jgi:ABC-2 type transport system ATP-binding protein
MDEAERCHRLAFIMGGKLLVHGTAAEVVRKSHLTTYSVNGPDLQALSERLTGCPDVEQAAAFGESLHVSGDDATALEQAIAPFRHEPYEWRKIEAGLEDVFMHYIGTSKEDEVS